MPAQTLPGLHSGVMATVTPGSPTSRSMGQYAKGHSFDRPKKPAAMFRGGGGGLKTHPTLGGMGQAGMGEIGKPPNLYGSGS